MLKHKEMNMDSENIQILINLDSIENVNERATKKEEFNDNYKMNQGFIDLISAYYYVENNVLNKNK
jgi:hypothetical protein